MGVVLVFSLLTALFMTYNKQNAKSTSDLTSFVLTDNFSEPTLSKNWHVDENWNGTISVSDDILTLANGAHKRINLAGIEHTGNSITSISARISLSGYYQKFGFNINPGGNNNNIGIYFDTFCPLNTECTNTNSTFKSSNNTVYSFVRDNNGNALSSSNITIATNTFHVFRIMVAPYDISFFIDNNLIHKTHYAVEGRLVPGIWNDRASAMKINWIMFEQHRYLQG